MNTIKKRADALLREVVPPPAAAPARCATQRAIEANGGMPLMNPFDTAAVECKVHGSGISMAAVRHPAEFCIEAYDGTGARKQSGGDAFFVAIRGASRVRARITDKGDGSYKVEWKPPQSGQYQIAVSFFGLALPGSPFTLTATTPVPFAPHCVAKGAALYNAVARATQSFQVQFKDRLGNVSAMHRTPHASSALLLSHTCSSVDPCSHFVRSRDVLCSSSLVTQTAHAVDLDVYVEPLPMGSPRGKIAGGSQPPSPELETAELAPPKKEEGGGGKRVRVQSSASGSSGAGSSSGSGAGGGGGAVDSGGDGGGAAPKAGTSALLVEVPTAEEPSLTLQASAGEPGSPDGSGIYEFEEPDAKDDTIVKNRTIRVKVGSAPLVIRAEQSTESIQIGYVVPGQMVTVLKEVISQGKVRAMIALDTVSREPEATLKREGSIGGGGGIRFTPAGIEYTNSSSNLLGGGSSSSLTGGMQSSTWMPPPEELQQSRGESPMPSGGGSGGSVIDGGGDGGETYGGSSDIEGDEGRGGGGDTDGEDNKGGFGGEGGEASGIVLDAASSSGASVGWVTLVKQGKKLVTSRVRQSANSRQQHAQQWTRRLANDKVRTSEKYKNIQSTHTVDLELSSDPSGIGFAFGGIHPGTLHAKGNLHETHSVSYSIGLVGEYLLHVRLRQQAAAVPGSPFQLVVMPGAAHALSTTLPKDKILGIVGKSEDTGCGVTIVTADVTGNACVKGGARVTGECSSSGVESSVEDRGDGSYRLIWHSQLSGTFSVAIKIDEVHVVGSPTQIKLISTHPELSRSEVSGEGLNLCVAGQPATFNIQFLDEFGNAANPKETFELGLALLKNGDKNKEAKMHEEFSMQVVDREKGLYLVEYTARQDGNFDLHVWAEDHSIAPPKNDPEFKYDQVMFPNSPFHCVVQAGAASPYKSFLDGWSKESRAVDKHGKAVQSDSNLIIAGDSVLVRPQICDELGNTATLPEGALDVTLVYPDGIEHHMNPNDQKLKMTTQTRGGITSYDIRHEATHAGEHQVHVRLHGQEIIGSPVSFLVHESVAEVKMCQLTPPPEPLLYSSNTYTTILKTFDRFGNPMSKGGLPVSTRLQLIKQGVHDLTTLMPNNNNVEVEDMGNGSYHINVTLLKIAATVKLVVNMDKNIPAAGGELQPVQLVFLPAEGEGGEGDAADSAATAPAPAPVDPKKQNVRLREAGNEVMQMMGVGDPGLKPKAAIAVAAEAFADAAKAKKKS